MLELGKLFCQHSLRNKEKLQIKHICDLSDRETIQQIRENVYMQYFIGYSGFSSVPAFDPSLFVELRARLGREQINANNERLIGLIEASPCERSENELLKSEKENKNEPETTADSVSVDSGVQRIATGSLPVEEEVVKTDGKDKKDKGKSKGKDKKTSTVSSSNRGRMLIDATVCPQDIAYPTDLNLLNDAREKSEELIDQLYDPLLHGKKPRTYRRKARKLYLGEAQKKSSTSRAIRKANGKQLNFLKRNIGHIHRLLDKYSRIPLDRRQYKYLLVIQTLYDQQQQMHKNRLKTIERRIVSIHQPHVRPIVRDKRNAKVEFGAKIQVCLMNGFAFL